jgi:uncharacterized membrane protein YjjB (DUF3815 family)
MDFRTFLLQPRPPYRTLSAFLGVALLVIGFGFGIGQRFSNWPVVAFLGAFGGGLLIAAVALSEATLQRLFMAAVAINIFAALVALLLGVS